MNFFLISPFLATQKYGKIERLKKYIGTWSGVISSQPSETAKFLLRSLDRLSTPQRMCYSTQKDVGEWWGNALLLSG